MKQACLQVWFTCKDTFYRWATFLYTCSTTCLQLWFTPAVSLPTKDPYMWRFPTSVIYMAWTYLQVTLYSVNLPENQIYLLWSYFPSRLYMQCVHIHLWVLHAVSSFSGEVYMKWAFLCSWFTCSESFNQADCHAISLSTCHKTILPYNEPIHMSEAHIAMQWAYPHVRSPSTSEISL
jgi:hypothetical protein